MFSPERLLEVVRSETHDKEESVIAYWCKVSTGRNEVRNRLLELRGDDPIIPLPLRSHGFDSPNALFTDLVSLIEKHEEDFSQEPLRFTDGSIILILLSLTELNLPQIASPIVMPEWFPQCGGQTIYLKIRDLNTSAIGPMNVPEARVSDMCERLFNLEGLLLERLEQVNRCDPRLSNSFFDYFKTTQDKERNLKFHEFLAEANASRALIKNRAGYRPSADPRKPSALIGRLMIMMVKTSPDQLFARSKSLATALAISDGSKAKESIVTVIMRPTQRIDEASVRLALNMLVTIYAASQFVTAASHADDYASFQLTLLQDVSYNLRETLNNFCELLTTI